MKDCWGTVSETVPLGLASVEEVGGEEGDSEAGEVCGVVEISSHLPSILLTPRIPYSPRVVLSQRRRAGKSRRRTQAC